MSMAVVLGIGSGLIEGVGHMALQRMNLLENVWYPIIWIAAVFNGIVVTALAAVLSLTLGRNPDRLRLRTAAVFLVIFAAVLPCLALMFKDWAAKVAGERRP